MIKNRRGLENEIEKLNENINHQEEKANKLRKELEDKDENL